MLEPWEVGCESDLGSLDYSLSSLVRNTEVRASAAVGRHRAVQPQGMMLVPAGVCGQFKGTACWGKKGGLFSYFLTVV